MSTQSTIKCKMKKQRCNSMARFLILTSQSNQESKVVEGFSETASDAQNYNAEFYSLKTIYANFKCPNSIVSDSTRYNFGDNTPQASLQCSPRGVTL
jgi:hypothetical protein